MPVSQIDRLERQSPNLAINVFGWENEKVIVHRFSEKDGEIRIINLMITKQDKNTHYSYVKTYGFIVHAKKHGGVKHFCKCCLHTYTTRDLLERHKPECKGLLKSPTRTETQKEKTRWLSQTTTSR